MEAYYILIVVVLFILAISDLIVGVSNDAVNFLNSAIGSKAASFKYIIIIAAVGVLVGAVFSNGMMEVARKGIFHPDMFGFDEIMIIFLAVMMTDILLLDFYNTIGLPTSTTVSIVFELLGSAVAVSIYKISKSGIGLNELSNYINTNRAVLIISGIFLSVIVAFTVGMIIQWIVRLAFSFNIKKGYRFWGGLWGGFSVTAILYFLLIKGAKGSVFVSPETLDFIKMHTVTIVIIGFILFSILFQLLVRFTRINVLKITVLIGTFALAMAFAGNDLVNFIGVPLAGFESFKAFFASGAAEPSGFMMEALKEPVKTPVYFLIGAGLIMVLTLRFSRKAKSVVATTLALSRQGEGQERFASSFLARFFVRRSVELSKLTRKVTPKKITSYVDSRFDENDIDQHDKKELAFDLVRASVNLVVASILIAIGTSLKLPLSTTYVTFMVAMGTSLSDGAWGRESAVYRITGVLTVIGGWFFTAFSAFFASFLLATLIYFGKLPVIIALIAISAFVILRTHAFHKKKVTGSVKSTIPTVSTESLDILNSCNIEVRKSIVKVSKVLFLTYSSFSKEKLKDLKTNKKDAKQLRKDVQEIKDSLPVTLKKFSESEFESGHYYVQLIDHLKETSNSLYHIVIPAFRHVDNNHPLDNQQMDELNHFNEELSDFFNYALNLLQKGSFEDEVELSKRRDQMIGMINDIILNRIKILKKKQKGVKVSITYIEMLSETKNLVLHIVQLLKTNKQLNDSLYRK